MVHRGDSEIRAWLSGRIGAGMRLGLSSCEEMLSRLGNPQRSFPSVHVAGTNGKGSLCAHLSSMGSNNGQKIGLFTSPHLIVVEERIRIDGRPLESQKLDGYISQIRAASLQDPKIEPTYFEVTFLASMLAFADFEVDRAVIETGMGGRLDSTRLVEADICAITTISLEHTEVLGDSLPQIASEKAGIHREGRPLLCLYHADDEVRSTIENIGGSDVRWISPISNSSQEIARELAAEVGEILGWETFGYEVRWHGRTRELLDWSGVSCRVSAAHNEESISDEVRSISDGQHVMIIGMTAKDHIGRDLSPFSNNSSIAHIIATDVNGGRLPTIPSSVLSEQLTKIVDCPVEIVPDPISAMDKGADLAKKSGLALLAIGSIHLVGKIHEEMIARKGMDLSKELTIH